MEKLCVFCEHIGYKESGCGDYAEPASLHCRKKHKLLSGNELFDKQFVFDIDDFRKMIKTAENCIDYTPPKEQP